MNILQMPIPLAVQSKAWLCGHWLAGIVSSNPTGDFLSLGVL